MKKLGRIFKDRWFFIAVSIGLILLFVQPWKWFSLNNDGSRTGIAAKKLFDAMQGFGTDEGELFNVLEVLSPRELNQVYDKFGLRWYNKRLGTQSGSLFGQKYDLFAWFSYELNEKEKQKMRVIWESTGREITF
ncbi:hypothetical protein [Mariniphaga sediminis]|uniref:hypothetical protein n=1 Tax=Mariniphaga sediminis TaxID=1628158 RepID=UPI0035642FCC